MNAANQIRTQLFYFSIIGILGFIVDVAVLDTVVHYLKTDPYLGRLISFFAAATTTWWLNRTLTFRRKDKHTFGEWIGYVSLMMVGALANFTIYSIIVWSAGSTYTILLTAVAAGSVSGMCIHFISARSILGKVADNETR